MKKAAPTELAPQKIAQAKEVKSQVDNFPPGSAAKTAPAKAAVVKGISVETSVADTIGDTHGLVPKASDSDTTKANESKGKAPKAPPRKGPRSLAKGLGLAAKAPETEPKAALCDLDATDTVDTPTKVSLVLTCLF